MSENEEEHYSRVRYLDTSTMTTAQFILFSTGCTYCFLKAINPEVAQDCPVHTKEEKK